MLTTFVAAAALIAAPQHGPKPHPHGVDGPYIGIAGFVTNIPITSSYVYPAYYGIADTNHAHYGTDPVKVVVDNELAHNCTFHVQGTFIETSSDRNGAVKVTWPLSTSSTTLAPGNQATLTISGFPTLMNRVRFGVVSLTVIRESGGGPGVVLGGSYWLIVPFLGNALQPFLYDLLKGAASYCDGDTDAASVAYDLNRYFHNYWPFNGQCLANPTYFQPYGGVNGTAAFHLKQFLNDSNGPNPPLVDSEDTAGALEIALMYEGFTALSMKRFQVNSAGSSFNTVPGYITGPSMQTGPYVSPLTHETAVLWNGSTLIDPWFAPYDNTVGGPGDPLYSAGDPFPYWNQLTGISSPAPYSISYPQINTLN